MTDNEIVKAWGSCLKDNVDCAKCPLIHEDCHETILDLINRQKAENKELQDLIVKYNSEIAEQKAEIERLKRKLVAYEPSVDSGLFSQMLLEQKEKAEAFEKKWKAEVKSEAYREFAELLKCDWIANLYYCEDLDITDWIDNILKELVGDDDG